MKKTLIQCSLKVIFQGQKNSQKYITFKVWDFSKMLGTLLDTDTFRRPEILRYSHNSQ